ncbi:putative Protein spinster-like protein 1 [Cardiosporidium cionae]|uniref:Major facilitator superfamily (MFS) profile domain-containing protein n=1 Tax=Cardiosporidium cionae TaxID=476202 RepID=A0ABQ7J961_9APIC|nr:putative Protein spinster-like protein 1 [Cardiosporidium cionae]|eukprot:KAF8820538.1 putative Protein spinster-like protein 1 [Cardiosporidium cionae]
MAIPFTNSKRELPFTDPSKGERDSPQRVSTLKPQVLLNVACALEGADASLLPASFRALERDQNFSLILLGRLALYQSFAASVFGPFWGYLCDKLYNKGILLVFGCAFWGILTILMSFSNGPISMSFLRFFNGIALSSINPISQTILSEIFPSKEYGYTFGWVQVAISCGTLFGNLFCTSISEKLIFGFRGWRFAFFLTGLACLFYAFILYKQLPKHYITLTVHRSLETSSEDLELPPTISTTTAAVSTKSSAPLSTPSTINGNRRESMSTDSYGSNETLEGVNSIHARRAKVSQNPPMALIAEGRTLHISKERFVLLSRTCSQLCSALKDMALVVIKCFRTPTFVIIALQGIFGSVPWNALSFLTLYYQYSGLSNSWASFLTSSLTLGLIPGSLLGGFIGDSLNLWNPNHGRPMTAQLSVLIGLPLIASVFQVLPVDPSPTMIIAHAFLLFIFGLVSSWCSAGVNRPILLEIIEPEHRGQILAWLVAVEGSSAAFFGAPFTAFLAQTLFGYAGISLPVTEMNDEERSRNLIALGNALTLGVTIPFIICAVCYSFLHFTLKRDRKNLQHGPAYRSLVSTHDDEHFIDSAVDLEWAGNNIFPLDSMH